MHDGTGQRLDVGDEAGTALVQDEHDGLTRAGKRLNQVALIG